jgi:hypothetical protein
LQRSVDARKQALRCGLFIARGAIDLPGKEQALDLARFKLLLSERGSK